MVTVQWRKGETGSGGTYVFSPKPNIQRVLPTQRLVEFIIPDVAGTVVQTLGKESRKIRVSGVIAVRNPNFDDLDELKSGLENGVSDGIGQLHLISTSGATNARHVYYKGIVQGGITWDDQKNMVILNYTFDILCPDPVEYVYVP